MVCWIFSHCGIHLKGTLFIKNVYSEVSVHGQAGSVAWTEFKQNAAGVRACAGAWCTLTEKDKGGTNMKGQAIRSCSKAHLKRPTSSNQLPKISINSKNNALVKNPAYGAILYPDHSNE